MTASRRAARIDSGFVPAPGGAVHTVEIDGEAVLLDQSGNRLHHLNPTATLVWTCLDGRASIAEIAVDLSRGFGAPHDSVLADTIAVTRLLGDEGLLANVEPKARATPDA